MYSPNTEIQPVQEEIQTIVAKGKDVPKMDNKKIEYSVPGSKKMEYALPGTIGSSGLAKPY